MNLNINTDRVRLTINDDPSRVISFNPNDVGFVDRFYKMIKDFEIKSNEYKNKEKELEADNTKDEYGLPLNTQAQLDNLTDCCKYIREQIDAVFGEGTSQTVFENDNAIEYFTEFFEGIAPYITSVRSKKINKYTEIISEKKALK